MSPAEGQCQSPSARRIKWKAWCRGSTEKQDVKEPFKSLCVRLRAPVMDGKATLLSSALQQSLLLLICHCCQRADAAAVEASPTLSLSPKQGEGASSKSVQMLPSPPQRPHTSGT